MKKAEGHIFDWNFDGSSLSTFYSAYSYSATTFGGSSSNFEYVPITSSTNPSNAI
jgi:hypothetical protein